MFRWNNFEESGSRPHAKPARMMYAKVNEAVKTLAVDQCLQSSPYMNIWRWFTGLSVPHDTDRMGFSGVGKIANFGLKTQDLVRSDAAGFEINGDKWGIVDADAHLLDRRHKVIRVAFLLQDGRKQANQLGPANRGAKIKPGAIARDPNVEVPAKGRIPKMNRRQTARTCGTHRGRDTVRRRDHILLCAHSFCHLLCTRYTLTSTIYPRRKESHA